MSGRWRRARRLTEREQAIVEAVARLRVVSGRQLQEVFFADGTVIGSRRRSQATLKKLVDDHFLVRLERRVGGERAGSAGYCYRLGTLGRRFLEPSDRPRPASEPGLTFVRHHLAIAELWVGLSRAEQAGGLKLLELQTEPNCWRRVPAGIGGWQWLKPDLFVSLAAGELEWRWFIEVDLGTLSKLRVERTCRRYAAYYRAGIEQDEHGVFPSVAWLAHTQSRAQSLRTVVDRLPAEDRRLFHVELQAHAPQVLIGGRP